MCSICGASFEFIWKTSQCVVGMKAKFEMEQVYQAINCVIFVEDKKIVCIIQELQRTEQPFQF